MNQTYDVIVLGAGAMGSAAAYHAAKTGHRVLLLEQFEVGHDRGSSHGHSRIIRYSYDNPFYVRLAKAAYPMWYALEDEAKVELYRQTGGLDFGFPGTQTLDNTVQTIQALNIPHEILSPDEANQRFPAFHFHPDMQILYQPDTGLLDAAECVQTHIKLAKQHGAIIKDNTPVIDLTVNGNTIEVRTPHEIFSAGKLILAAGVWMKALLAKLDLYLPLTPMRCQLNFFEPLKAQNFQIGQFPAFIGHLVEGFPHRPYGMISPYEPGVKIAFHGGDTVNDPSEIDYNPSDIMVEEIRKFTALYMPDANGQLIRSLTCLYTMTPDEHFIIDRHPEYPQVIVASPCSGHGFKFSTLIGSILTDLAFDGQTKHDISLFNIERFVEV